MVSPFAGYVAIIDGPDPELRPRSSSPVRRRGSVGFLSHKAALDVDRTDSWEQREAQRREARARAQERVRQQVGGRATPGMPAVDLIGASPAEGLARALVVEVGPFVPVLTEGCLVWYPVSRGMWGPSSPVIEVAGTRLLNAGYVVAWEAGE